MSEQQDEPVVVVSGRALAAGGGEGSDAARALSSVEQPAKVMRIGSMVKQLLEEVRGAPLDDAGRARLRADPRALHHGARGRAGAGAGRGAASASSLPFGDRGHPTDAELRIAQAQLVGWLEGLFHGIQTALVAQQMAARAQLEQMRALPAGPGAGHPSGPGTVGTGPERPAPGQYL